MLRMLASACASLAITHDSRRSRPLGRTLIRVSPSGPAFIVQNSKSSVTAVLTIAGRRPPSSGARETLPSVG